MSLNFLQIAIQKRQLLDAELQTIDFEMFRGFLSEQLNCEVAKNYLLTTFADISLQLFPQP